VRLRYKVTVAVLGGTLWLGAVAAQGADRPAPSLARASATAHGIVPSQRAGSQNSPARPLLGDEQASLAGDAATEPTSTTSTLPSGSATTSPAHTPSPAVASAAAKISNPGGYDAGGSMSGSSSVSQAYSQTTQSGWGCQAALQYLSQHANPEFSLVCPGYAMGHQAMTCYYQEAVCPNSAQIIIADPCPAAYENEAWNSWHMATGPYDPYGWCSNWAGQQGPVDSVPPPTGGRFNPGTPGDSTWLRAAAGGP